MGNKKTLLKSLLADFAALEIFVVARCDKSCVHVLVGYRLPPAGLAKRRAVHLFVHGLVLRLAQRLPVPYVGFLHAVELRLQSVLYRR
jgi:hypothetical protein